MTKYNTHVVVKNLPDNVMDVFWGEGWDNWSRIRLAQESKPDFVHLQGIKLPFYVRIALARYLHIEIK
jgi:hypothetical protein